MFKILGFMGLMFLVAALYIYVFGAFIMFVTGNGRIALTWPYHFFRERYPKEDIA